MREPPITITKVVQDPQTSANGDRRSNIDKHEENVIGSNGDKKDDHVFVDPSPRMMHWFVGPSRLHNLRNHVYKLSFLLLFLCLLKVLMHAVVFFGYCFVISSLVLIGHQDDDTFLYTRPENAEYMGLVLCMFGSYTAVVGIKAASNNNSSRTMLLAKRYVVCTLVGGAIWIVFYGVRCSQDPSVDALLGLLLTSLLWCLCGYHAWMFHCSVVRVDESLFEEQASPQGQTPIDLHHGDECTKNICQFFLGFVEWGEVWVFFQWTLVWLWNVCLGKVLAIFFVLCLKPFSTWEYAILLLDLALQVCGLCLVLLWEKATTAGNQIRQTAQKWHLFCTFVCGVAWVTFFFGIEYQWLQKMNETAANVANKQYDDYYFHESEGQEKLAPFPWPDMVMQAFFAILPMAMSFCLCCYCAWWAQYHFSHNDGEDNESEQQEQPVEASGYMAAP